jgi:STE24 endopeptidase
MRAKSWLSLGLTLALLIGVGASVAQTDAAPATTVTTTERDFPPGLVIPPEAMPGPDFDAERATQAYLALMTPEQRAKSDAYFEGGYWLTLWQLVYALVVAGVLIATGLSRRLREIAQRVTMRHWPMTWLYALLFVGVSFVLNLPMAIYAEWWREHQYGLQSQSFGGWFGDGLKGLVISALIFPLIIATIYAAVRRARDSWWAWAAGITLVFAIFGAMIAPVYIAPLFNEYKPLANGELRDSLLSLARANRIPATDVWQFDASKQTTRVSANVSGMFHTTRVSLNDNLLYKTSDPEIRAVMGHEMGHYVLNHSVRLVIYITLLLAAGYFFLHKTVDWAIGRYGARHGVTDRTDPAGLPIALAMLSVFLFVATPVFNTIIRQAEAEADMFGLDAAREPHGFAMAAMRLSTYRKLHPGPLEEIIFYDHPSGYDRVLRSMQWLAENQDDPHVLAAVAQANRGINSGVRASAPGGD